MTDVHSSSQIVMEKVIKNAAYANDLPRKQISRGRVCLQEPLQVVRLSTCKPQKKGKFNR